MRKWRILFIISMVVWFDGLHAQDFSNRGKDFWVGYGSHISMYKLDGTIDASGGTQNMVLYFTSDEDAQVTVEMPAAGWSKKYKVKAGSVTETDAIPKTGSNDARLATEGVSDKGIHITSDKNIVAYTHIYDLSNSGASLLFPTTTLGQDYYILGFKQFSNSYYAYPYCFVIATEDNTTVEITPSVNTLRHKASQPFTTTLKKGQVFNLLASLNGGSNNAYTAADLTGTRIRTISTGSGSCKRIAVFCGSGKLSIVCDENKYPTGDNTIQQVLPYNAWGLKYIAAPTKGMDNNFFRVMVSDPTTVVKLNGKTLTNIINGRYYEFQTNAPAVIEGSKEVMVAQFITTADQCNNSLPDLGGDPEMIFLSPVEQNISQVVLNSTDHYQIQWHFINVVLKTTDIPSFSIDGQAAAAAFQPVPGSPDFSYAQLPVKAGVHHLRSLQGFNAIAYGYGHAESYGYNAGTNVKDNYQYISAQHPCKNALANLSVVLPYKPLSITWLMKDNPIITPNANAMVYNPEPDSIFTRNGRTLYVFKLKGDYRFTSAGAGTLSVQVNNPMPDGCSGMQEISVDITNYEQPAPAFSISDTLCAGQAVRFTDLTAGDISKRYWDYGNGIKDTLLQTKSKDQHYAAAGDYRVSLTVETAGGCKSNTITQTISIAAAPQAAFILPVVCKDATARFKDSSYMTDGSTPRLQYAWNFGDPHATHENPNTSVQQNPSHAYNAYGDYQVKLKVATGNKCTSSASRLFRISSNMIRAGFDIVSAAELCSGDSLLIRNTSSIDYGSITRIAVYWDAAGDPELVDIDNQPAFGKLYRHAYTMFHQPASRTVEVKMLAYAGTTCVAVQSHTIVLHARPAVLFSPLQGSCVNAAARQLTEATETSGVPGSFIFSGTGVSGNGQFDPHITGTGSFPVQALYVTDKGCRDSVTQTITVWPQPVADWTNTVLCEKQQVQFSGQSTGPGDIVQWNWTTEGATIPPAQAQVINTRYDSAGNYRVALQVKTDKGCLSAVTEKNITLHAKPLVDFSDPVVCLPDGNGTFNDRSSIQDATENAFSYNWDFGDSHNPQSSIQKNPTHRYLSTGTYTTQLTVTSKYGCTASLSRSFSAVYPQPHAAFSVSATAICQGKTVQLTDHSASTEGAINTWQWNMGGRYTTNRQNPDHRFNEPGVFPVTLWVQDAKGCRSDTAQQSITVYAQPRLNAGPVVQVKEGESVQLKPSYAADSARFRWLPALYLSSDTAAAPYVRPLSAIIYHITLTAAGGCIAEDNLEVKLLYKPVVPNAFSPNGDGINDTWHIRYLEIYPDATVDVYNRYGQRVFTARGQQAKDWNGSYNGQPLEIGTYYYIIDLKNGAKPLSGYVVILK